MAGVGSWTKGESRKSDVVSQHEQRQQRLSQQTQIQSRPVFTHTHTKQDVGLCTHLIMRKWER